MIRRYAKAAGLLWLLGSGALVSALAAFALQVLLARSLGPGGFGLIQTAMVFVTLLVPFGTLGMPGYWLHLFGRFGGSANRYLKQSILIVIWLVGFCVVLISTWAYIGFHTGEMRQIYLFFGFVYLSLIIHEVLVAKLQVEGKYLLLSAVTPLHNLARLGVVLVCLMIVSHPSAGLVAQLYAGCAAFIAFIYLVMLWPSVQHGFTRPSEPAGGASRGNNAVRYSGRQLAWNAMPYGLATVFHLLYFQSDIFLLNYLSDSSVAGLYSAAVSILLAVYLIPSVAIQKYLMPKMHRWTYEDRARFVAAFKSSLTGLAITGLFLSLILLIWADSIVLSIFGEGYESSIVALRILSVAVIMRYVSSVLGCVISTRGYIGKKIRIMGSTAALNILLNLKLIPAYGMVGAAIATVVSELLLLVLYGILASTYFKSEFPRERDV